MRIVLVCPYSFDVPGGVGTHVRGLAQWLRGNGYDAVVVAPGTFSGDDQEILVGGAKGFAFNGSVANLAISPHQMRMVRGLVKDADVVHVHEPLTPGIGFAAALTAKRLVVTHHASFRPRLTRPVLRAMSRMIGPRVAMAVSKAAAFTALSATGIRPLVVPNAIELPPAGKRADGLPLVFFVGRRDDPRKGFRLFMDVAERMQDEARFVAIGPGHARSDYVADLGVVTDADLHEWLRQGSVLLAPNTGGESFGMVLVEALAHGLSVAASDLPAFRDLAGGSSAFSWFPAGDVAAAASSLRARLADAPDPAASRRVAERYSWEVVGPRILAQYKRAAAS